MKNMKRRILNKELAALVAQIKHGEMIFIAEAVTGSPSFHDIFTTLKECGVLL